VLFWGAWCSCSRESCEYNILWFRCKSRFCRAFRLKRNILYYCLDIHKIVELSSDAVFGVRKRKFGSEMAAATEVIRRPRNRGKSEQARTRMAICVARDRRGCSILFDEFSAGFHRIRLELIRRSRPSTLQVGAVGPTKSSPRRWHLRLVERSRSFSSLIASSRPGRERTLFAVTSIGGFFSASNARAREEAPAVLCARGGSSLPQKHNGIHIS